MTLVGQRLKHIISCILTLDAHRHPSQVVLVFLGPKFLFAIRVTVLSYRHFWDNHTERSHNNLEQCRVKVHHVCVTSVKESPYTSLHSGTSRFRVTGHVKTSVPNCPQTTLNDARWKVHHTFLLLLYLSPKFRFILLHDEPFWRHMHIAGESRKCTKITQNDLNHFTGNRALYTLISPKAKILVRFAQPPAIFKISHNCNSPLTTMLNVPQRTTRICQNSNFEMSSLLTILVESLSTFLAGCMFFFFFWGGEGVFLGVDRVWIFFCFCMVPW